MGLLQDQFLADNAGIFDLDGFAESVTYTPLGGSLRTIHAVIERHPRDRMSQSGELWKPSVVVSVANDSTTGISSADTNTVGGVINIAIRLGQTAKALTIQHDNIESQDGGVLRLVF